MVELHRQAQSKLHRSLRNLYSFYLLFKLCKKKSPQENYNQKTTSLTDLPTYTKRTVVVVVCVCFALYEYLTYYCSIHALKKIFCKAHRILIHAHHHITSTKQRMITRESRAKSDQSHNQNNSFTGIISCFNFN